ncbi:MAG: HTH-type transcriptional repressor RspR [Verrucomicrobiota bacterium]|jgi:DNA-binding GntR family transcriptional regulator
MKSVNSDVAYDFIRKKILNGDYPPGHALMTEVLSAEIGVSRTPVRDALRKLETDGLVVIQPRLGASVKKMYLKEFRELCELRLALEVQMAGLAAINRTEAELHEIEYALEGMRRLTKEVNAAKDTRPMVAELVREDVRFHVAIMTAAKNELMKKEILRLHLIHRVTAPARENMKEEGAAKAVKDAHRLHVMQAHEAIYAAIAKGDAAAAKLAMEAHIQDLINIVMRTMARNESGVIAHELTPEELVYST